MQIRVNRCRWRNTTARDEVYAHVCVRARARVCTYIIYLARIWKCAD